MSINESMNGFESHLKVAGCAKCTLESYRRTLRKFEKYLQLQDRSNAVEQIMKQDITGFLGTCEENGEKRTSIIFRLAVIKKFFRWLKEESRIAADPAAAIPMPKEARRIPRYVSPQQMEALLERPDIRSPLGLRDRALMEVIYSTGLRISEVLALELEDIDWQQGFLYVRNGKGGRPRNVPIGKTALQYLERYILEARRKLEADCSTLVFLSRGGNRMKRQLVAELMHEYCRKAGLPEWITPHVLRHAAATHMLQGGAGLAYIQELLGHARAESTRIYTLVRSEDLKSVHTNSHPRK